MTVEEIQDRFRECFPSLEIVFYTAPYRKAAAFNSACQIGKRERIEGVRQYHYNGTLEIKSWFPVAKVEKELKELFDLHAHIFRIGAGGKLVDTAMNDELARKQ